MKKYKLLGLCLALTMGGSLVSCNSNDDVPSLDTKVYINTENVPVNFIHAGNLVQNNVINKLIESVHEIKFPVRITMPYSRDVQVQLAIKPDLLVAYNEEYGTDYTLINKEALDISNATLTIPKGAMESTDSLKITIADFSKLGEGTDFALPISIASVTNSSDLKISTNQSLVLATIKKSLIDAKLVNTAPGIVVDCSQWTSTDKDAQLAIDGVSTTTVQMDVRNEDKLVYDLHGEGTYKGFSITPDYGSHNDPKTITFEISNNGTKWHSIGVVTMGKATAVDMDDPYAQPAQSVVQYVQFVQPIKASYIRLTFTSNTPSDWWWETPMVSFSELNLYK